MSAASDLERVAADFLAIGGRLMIDPRGRYESTLDMGELPESANEVATAFALAEREHEAQIAQLVRERGSPTPNGWRVWEAMR